MTVARDLSSPRQDVPADIDAEARDWVRKLAGGRPTTADAQAFLQWRDRSRAHRLAWAYASREWSDIAQVAEVFRAQHPEPAVAALARPQRRWFMGAAVSAAGALGVAAMVRPPFGLWPSWSELGADYRTAVGEQREIALAGQVQLMLNTRTSVSVREQGSQPRIELIAGEAAVNNPRAEPLEVHAGAGRIRLGAGGVEVRRLAAGRVTVLCTDGAAELWHPSGSVALGPRQEVAYDAATVGQPAQRPAVDASVWRQGMVAFDDTPLPAAIEEINRYRPGRVMLVGAQLAQQRISGRFRIESLDQAIVQIQELYGAEVTRVGELVLLG